MGGSEGCMKKNVGVFLTDILKCIGKIEAYMKGISKEKFMEDTELQDAVVRRVGDYG